MIILAVSATLILSLLGLVLDGGRIYYEKRRVQAAADSGVLAAVQELRRGNDDLANEVDPAAVFDTGLNGYDRDNSTVVVNVPPATGGAAGDPNAAEVIISRVVPTTFMRVAGRNASTVVARSVAGLRPTNDFCIYALNPILPGSFTNNGGASFNSTCGIMVNSNDPEKEIAAAKYFGSEMVCRVADRAVQNIAKKTGRSAADAKKALERMSPQGRMTRPDEVASLVRGAEEVDIPCGAGPGADELDGDEGIGGFELCCFKLNLGLGQFLHRFHFTSHSHAGWFA